MLSNLTELIQRLSQCLDILGLVRYGRRPVEDTSSGGDFDLFVIVTERPRGLESIHFHVGGIPVDLNVRTLSDLQAEYPLTCIDVCIASGEVLLDRTGELPNVLSTVTERWSQPARSMNSNERAAALFFQTHPLDKVRGRLNSDPLLCHFLLSTDIFWLVKSYFGTRGLAFPGENGALREIKQNAPDIYRLIERFYASSDLRDRLAIVEDITRLVLEPIGRPWHPKEILTLEEDGFGEDIQGKGRAYLAHLLGIPQEELD